MHDPRALAVEHLVDLRRYENGVRGEARRILDAAFRDIKHTLATRYADLTPYQRTRLEAMAANFAKTLGKAYRTTAKVTDLAGLVRVESAYTTKFLGAALARAGTDVALTALSAAKLKAISQFPVAFGTTMGQWWEKQGADMAFQVKRTVQMGLLQGQTTQQIVQRVTEGPERIAMRNAEAVVRTSITGVAAQANMETLAAQDPEVTDTYMYVATLDDRTSDICMALDGQIFPYKDGPQPPQHINCRSSITPVVNWEKMGVKVPAEVQDAFRAASGGPVKYRDYQAWLKDQPAATQNRILGPSRAELFRQDKVSLRDLVTRDGRSLTLAQLEKKAA